MKNRAKVTEIMTTKLVTLDVKDKLENAEKLFKKHNIRHIPVVKNDEIVGMLSDSDILRLSFGDVMSDESDVDSFVYEMFTIRQVMAKNVKMVPPTATIKEVAQMLVDKEFHALPVVDDKELIGIVTSTDLCRYLVTLLE